MNTSPVRVGIIGLGRSGWSIHALGLQQMPERDRIVRWRGAVQGGGSQPRHTPIRPHSRRERWSKF